MSTTKKALKDYDFKDRANLRDETAVELNDYIENTLHKKPLTEKRIKANVGGGVQIGDTFTLTGEVAVSEIADSQNVYLSVLTDTGDKLSIKSLILQSVAGYNDKKAVDELEPLKNGEDKATHEADENYKVVDATFDTEAAGGKTAAEVVSSNKAILDHGTRNDIELYGLIRKKLWSCKGLKLTYCGKVVRQTKATKNYPFGEVEVKKNARRAMTVSVWKITK